MWDIREQGAVQCRHVNTRTLYDQTNITMEIQAYSGDPRDVTTWRHDADASIDAAIETVETSFFHGRQVTVAYAVDSAIY